MSMNELLQKLKESHEYNKVLSGDNAKLNERAMYWEQKSRELHSHHSETLKRIEVKHEKQVTLLQDEIKQLKAKLESQSQQLIQSQQQNQQLQLQQQQQVQQQRQQPILDLQHGDSNRSLKQLQIELKIPSTPTSVQCSSTIDLAALRSAPLTPRSRHEKSPVSTRYDSNYNYENLPPLTLNPNPNGLIPPLVYSNSPEKETVERFGFADNFVASGEFRESMISSQQIMNSNNCESNDAVVESVSIAQRMEKSNNNHNDSFYSLAEEGEMEFENGIKSKKIDESNSGIEELVSSPPQKSHLNRLNNDDQVNIDQTKSIESYFPAQQQHAFASESSQNIQFSVTSKWIKRSNGKEIMVQEDSSIAQNSSGKYSDKEIGSISEGLLPFRDQLTIQLTESITDENKPTGILEESPQMQMERQEEDEGKYYQKKSQSFLERYMKIPENLDSKHNLFENFLMISASPEAVFAKKLKDNIIEKVPPKTIYSYPQNSTTNPIPNESDLHSFAFTDGVRIQQRSRQKSSMIFEQLIKNEDTPEDASQVFVFALLTDGSLERVDPNNPAQQIKPDIVDVLNPDKLRYCVCMTAKNFLIPPTNSTSSFIEVDVVYCFTTRLPHFEFFSQVLEETTMYIRRSKQYQLQQGLKKEGLGLHFIKTITLTIDKRLSELAWSKIPALDTTTVHLRGLNYVNRGATLKMPSEQSAQQLEAHWGLSNALARFGNNHLNFVRTFVSILLENSLLIVSQSRTLLSQFMLTLSALLKPLKWPHARLMGLPIVLQDILDSPVPVIVGINKPKAELDKHNLEKRFEHLNIIYLDEMIFFFQDDPIEQRMESNFIQLLCFEIENQFNLLATAAAASTTLGKSKDLSNSEIETISRNILTSTQNILLNTVISELPTAPGFEQGGSGGNQHVDYCSISYYLHDNIEFNDAFIKDFCQTQIFRLFLDEKYATLQA